MRPHLTGLTALWPPFVRTVAVVGLQYHVYVNDGLGGPVDLSAPVATVSGLTWDSPPLGPGSDTTWLIRTYDTATGYEEQNGDARQRVLIDDAGEDVTSLPSPPSGLTARATPGGAVVHWAYPPGLSGGAPSGFHVYLGTPTPDYSAPAAAVAHTPGSPARIYSATLAGLADGVAYQVSVRSFNAAGEEANTRTVTVTGMAAGPSPVVSLSASVVP